MERIFNENTEKQKNFYEILGCEQSSSIEQIMTEFKIKALTDHPDKNPNDMEAKNRFQVLLEAKETLTDAKLRDRYDFWLNSCIGMPWKEWLNFTSKNTTVFHWVIKKPEPALTEQKCENSTDSTDCLNENQQKFKHDRNNKFNNSSESDYLSKFRSYQI